MWQRENGEMKMAAKIDIIIRRRKAVAKHRSEAEN
jgi:hypothetical protein